VFTPHLVAVLRALEQHRVALRLFATARRQQAFAVRLGRLDADHDVGAGHRAELPDFLLVGVNLRAERGRHRAAFERLEAELVHQHAVEHEVRLRADAAVHGELAAHLLARPLDRHAELREAQLRHVVRIGAAHEVALRARLLVQRALQARIELRELGVRQLHLELQVGGELRVLTVQLGARVDVQQPGGDFTEDEFHGLPWVWKKRATLLLLWGSAPPAGITFLLGFSPC
jgi:hypothetical protein